MNEPLLLGTSDTIIHGVARWEAAKMLGHKKVPCIRIAHLSETQQRLLRLALNRLGEKGQWELAELRLEFQELILLKAPIEVTAFTTGEIDNILMLDVVEATEVGPLTPAPGASPVTQPGDLWRLGDHLVICGDARESATLDNLMTGSASARIVFTDVPYNVKIGGNVTGGSHREFAMASGEMTPEVFSEFNDTWIANALRHLVDGGILARS